jgi:hypothetical protein
MPTTNRDHVTPITYKITHQDRTITGKATLYGPIEHHETLAALRQRHHASSNAAVQITPQNG